MEENFEKTCACRGGTLGKFVQPIILNILNSESCNGYQIIKRMQNYSTFENTKPDPTGIYRYLRAMEEKGLIEKNDASDTFKISVKGAECLQNWKITLMNYRESISALIEELR